MKDYYEDGKIFVGGLAQETNKESMRRHFSQFGNITDSVVMIDTLSGRSRGFGFVTFDNAEAIDLILASKQVLDGKNVDCKRACPRDSMNHSSRDQQDISNTYQTEKCFVGGLPDVTTEEFRSYFEQFGRVVDAVLMTDRNSNRPRGFGFVTFEKPETADEVVKNSNKHHFRGKWVEVKKATPKEFMSRGGRGGPPAANPPYGQQQMFRNYGPQRSGPYNPYSMDRRAHGGAGNNMYSMYGANNAYNDMYQGFAGYGGDSGRGRSDYSAAYGRPAYNDGYAPVAYASAMDSNYVDSGPRGYGGDGYAQYGDMMGATAGFNHYVPASMEVYPPHGPQRGSRAAAYGQRSLPY